MKSFMISLIVSFSVLFSTAQAAMLNILQNGNQYAISFIGEIEEGDSIKFNELMEKNEITYVFFHSIGGRVDEAMSIGQTMAGSDVIARVEYGNICLSACALSFIGANSGIIQGQVGFHIPYWDEKAPNEEESDRRSQLEGIYSTSYMINMGFSPAFLQVIYSLTSKQDYLMFEHHRDLYAFYVGKPSEELAEKFTGFFKEEFQEALKSRIRNENDIMRKLYEQRISFANLEGSSALPGK